MGNSDYLGGVPFHAERLYGGYGNDYFNGGAWNSDSNSDLMYGEAGYDIMHEGYCNGGTPSTDTDCEDYPAWDTWPDYGTAGDCCCGGCHGSTSCLDSDITSLIDCPQPWVL
jgi:hypothetical protein